jgi:hypothetical protein
MPRRYIPQYPADRAKIVGECTGDFASIDRSAKDKALSPIHRVANQALEILRPSVILPEINNNSIAISATLAIVICPQIQSFVGLSSFSCRFRYLE